MLTFHKFPTVQAATIFMVKMRRYFLAEATLFQTAEELARLCITDARIELPAVLVYDPRGGLNELITAHAKTYNGVPLIPADELPLEIIEAPAPGE